MARKIASIHETTKAFTPEVVTANSGTTSTTFAGGADSRITGAAQKASNLSDLASAATARSNLGLGTAATTAATDYATAAQGATADAAQPSNPEVWSDWTDNADGSPATLDSGHAVTHTNGYDGDADANLRVVSGRLTNTTTAAATRAGYVTVLAGATVRRLGAAWTWDGATPAGAVALIDWMTALPSGTIGAIPNAACHLVVDTTQVLVGIFDGGALDLVNSWAWPTAPESGTEYQVDAFIDPATDTVTILLPWGEVVSYTDARVSSHAGAFPCWELYLADASAASRPGFTHAWADTEPGHARAPFATPASISRALDLQRTLTATDTRTTLPKAVQSTTAASVALTSDLATIDGSNLHCEHTVPASGAILIEASLYVTTTTAGRMIWQTANGATPHGTRFMTNETGEGYIHYRTKVSGLTPGSTFDAIIKAQILDGGAATVTIGTNNPAELVVTPLG